MRINVGGVYRPVGRAAKSRLRGKGFKPTGVELRLNARHGYSLYCFIHVLVHRK